MRFDINTSSYVPVSRSHFDKRIHRYQSSHKKLCRDSKYNDANEDLNKYSKAHDDLFSEKNLNILRYTFFSKFTNDYDQILKDMKAKTNNVPKLKYMRKLKEIKARDKAPVQGLPNLSTDNLTSMECEMGDYDNLTDDDSQAEDEYEHDDLTDFNSLYSKYESWGSKNHSIKEAIKSNQFWNDIYQELRFNMMELSSTSNYFEFLPSLHQLATFYKEVIEHFLLNVSTLSCNLSGLSDTEHQKLSTYRFLYLRDFDYDWLKLMSELHYDLFDNQAELNSTMSIHHDSDFKIHRNLVNKVIETIIDNFKATFGNSGQSSYEIQLWERFLRYLMFEVIIKNYGTRTNLSASDTLPEPNVEMSRSSSLTNNSLENSLEHSFMTTTTSADDIVQLSKNSKHLSLNLNSRVSVIKEEKQFGFGTINDEIEMDYEDEASLPYKRRGFIIEPPTPRVESGAFTTPLSTTFSLTSDGTKSHVSKRSIFSRFRKVKTKV
ncbi:hypothetical protein PSN45_000477 [Yamadazyma tenuis]|nr:hypothetical protein PSN45_000477 [Yamadazyma tenuis]